MNLDALALLPEGCGWLMVEFGADTADEAEAQARHLMEALDRSAAPPNMQLFTNARLMRRIWDVRESSLGVTSHVPGEPLRWEGFEDSAVGPEKLGAYLRDLRRLMQDHHYDGSFYGHFGHACVHTRMDYDLESTEGIRKFRQFMEEAADLVVRYGGSISGEHGDGQSRGELLPKMFGPELMQAFREFKIALGSRLEDEPRQAHQSLSARRKSPPRRRLRSLAARDAFQISRRPRQSWRPPPCAA